MGIPEALSTILQGAVAFTFTAATLKAASASTTVKASGGVTKTSTDYACLAKVDMRHSVKPDGGTVYITRIIILAGSVAVVPAEGNSIVIGANTYKLGPIRRDGIASHYVCEVADG